MALDNLRDAVADTLDHAFAEATCVVLTQEQVDAMQADHMAPTNPAGRLFKRNIVPTLSFFGCPVAIREPGDDSGLTVPYIDYRTHGTD